MSNTILEICVDSVSSAIDAEKGGADRIELCSNLIIGGTTPGYELYRCVREHINIPVHVLIRPRFGDFLYDEYEKEIMKKEVARFSEMGADAVVIGMLRENGTLDEEGMREILKDKNPGTSVTLHRAFDMTADPYQAAECAIRLGIQNILTSGQEKDCMAGKELIGNLNRHFSKAPIQFMAGGEIHSSGQVRELFDVGVRYFHMSGKKTVESAMNYRNSNVSMGFDTISEYTKWKTDWETISKIKSCMDEYSKMLYDSKTCKKDPNRDHYQGEDI